MMTQTYQRLIVAGIKGLPPAPLAEIADFIYFVRRRVREPRVYEEELQNALLGAELRQLSRDEEAHLEKEFEGYETRYPRE